MPKDYDTYERNTVAFRGGYEATNWLKVSSSLNFARSQTDAVGSFQGTSVIDGVFELPRDISIVDMKDTSSPFNTPEGVLYSLRYHKPLLGIGKQLQPYGFEADLR